MRLTDTLAAEDVSARRNNCGGERVETDGTFLIFYGGIR